MAKQVILAHPFERVSGNVTRAKQKLVYAENDNPAWEAPHSRQYARNFKPQMNLRYNASTGKTSFTIQTKSAVDNTEAGRLRLALFGGSQAVQNAIKKNPTLLAQAYEAYAEVRDYFKSFDSFLVKEIRKGLKTKAASILLGNSTGSGIYVNNPWVAGGTGTDVTISAEVMRKFATYLCPIVFSVDGNKYGVPDKHLSYICLNTDIPLKKEWYRKFNDGSFTLLEGGSMLPEEDEILYKGANIYKGSTKCLGSFEVANGDTLSTTAPNA